MPINNKHSLITLKIKNTKLIIAIENRIVSHKYKEIWIKIIRELEIENIVLGEIV